MKKNFIFLSLLTILSLNAGRGVITVLESPLLRGPDLNSIVIDQLRKGQTVYIHDKYFKGDPLEPEYYSSEDLKKIDWIENDQHPEFYLTSDKNGRVAYIPKEFVKLIYQDKREFSEPITPFSPDPTDYRLEEPLPDNYPVINKNRYRAQLSLLFGQDLKTNYPYDISVLEEKYSERLGFYAAYGKGADWDYKDQFYFGAAFHLWTSQSKFTLLDFRETQENKGQIGIGPYVSFDGWRTENYRITIQGALSISWNRVIVSQATILGDFEERIFQGFSFSPRISSFFQFRNLLPNIDFIAGADFQVYLPHSLQSSTQAELKGLWNEYGTINDTWSVPFTSHWSAFVGFQANY